MDKKKRKRNTEYVGSNTSANMENSPIIQTATEGKGEGEGMINCLKSFELKLPYLMKRVPEEFSCTLYVPQ